MTGSPVILQIIPALDAGGAERTVIEMTEAIVMGGGCALIACEGGRLEAEAANAGGELIRFPAAAKNPLAILANARKLERLIALRGVRLIHARSRAPAWSALTAARRAKIPFVTTYHGIYNQKGPLKSWYNGVMARGDIVIANSRYTAKVVHARHGTPPERLRVIHRGVDLKRFLPEAVSAERVKTLRAKWGVTPSARIVLLPARLTRWKGQFTALAAAARICAEPGFADVTFVLVGDDQGRTTYRAELQAKIAQLGLAGRAAMPGHCEDMPAAFLTASVAIIPSVEPEAFGRTSAEAQAMGCPVIVSDIGALPETIVQSGGGGDGHATGWTFPPGDAAALADRIAVALSMPPAAAREMAEAARQNATARFSKTMLQRETLRIYDDLLNSELLTTYLRNSVKIEDFQPSLHRIPL